MNICGEFLSLNVPGLAEGRPSLLIGDKIVASLTGTVYDASQYYQLLHLNLTVRHYLSRTSIFIYPL